MCFKQNIKKQIYTLVNPTIRYIKRGLQGYWLQGLVTWCMHKRLLFSHYSANLTYKCKRKPDLLQCVCIQAAKIEAGFASCAVYLFAVIGTAAMAIYFLSCSDYFLLFQVYIYFKWKVAEFLIFCPSMSSLSLVSSVNISELSHRLCASLFKLLLEILAVLMFSRSMTSCSCFIWSVPSCFYLSDIEVLIISKCYNFSYCCLVNYLAFHHRQVYHLLEKQLHLLYCPL